MNASSRGALAVGELGGRGVDARDGAEGLLHVVGLVDDFGFVLGTGAAGPAAVTAEAAGAAAAAAAATGAATADTAATGPRLPAGQRMPSSAGPAAARVAAPSLHLLLDQLLNGGAGGRTQLDHGHRQWRHRHWRGRGSRCSHRGDRLATGADAAAGAASAGIFSSRNAAERVEAAVALHQLAERDRQRELLSSAARRPGSASASRARARRSSLPHRHRPGRCRRLLRTALRRRCDERGATVGHGSWGSRLDG